MKQISNKTFIVTGRSGKFQALIIVVALIAASLMLLAGCKQKATPTSTLTPEVSASRSEDPAVDSQTESGSQDRSNEESQVASEDGSSEDPVSSQDEESQAQSQQQSQSTSSSVSSAAPTATTAPTPTTAANTKLFTENFESGMDRWTVSEGNFSIVSDGSKVLKQTNRDLWETVITAGETGWTDYKVTAKIKIHNGYSGLVGRYKDADNLYLFDLNEFGYSLWRKYEGGFVQLVSDTNMTIYVDQWHTAAIDFSGNQIRLYLDGEQLGDVINDNLIGNGKIGFRSSNGTFSVDDVTVE